MNEICRTTTRWIKSSCVFASLAAAVGVSTGSARAQETVFNVPSPDILERGKVYLETDQYFGSTQNDDGRAAFFLARGVFGLARSVEVGLNTGPFDYQHPSQPFIDAAVKWRPVVHPFGKSEARGNLGLFLGDTLGYGVRNDVSGAYRNYAYAAGYLELPGGNTRASLGIYHASRYVFSDSSRTGAQASFEQSIPSIKGFKLAVDWFSGEGGYATPGIIWSIGRSTIYTAYGFSNDGRPHDLITLEYGITLR